MLSRPWGILGLALVPTITLISSVWISAETPGKTLIVVAHPDDEYYCAATVYRMAVQLGGRVDELIITDGEGGFRYSTLAEPYYKTPLTIEAIGRKELPAIRRREAINAGKVLGIQTHYFLGEKDEHFTTDEEDGVHYGWNFALVTSKIAALVRRQHYQYIFTLLPRSTTHGYHQAATLLAASAILALPQSIRPVLLGFDTDAAKFMAPSKIQKTQRWRSTYAYAFDRTARFGFQNALTYQIVVNWMIAEHKSQGLLQTMDNKDPKEFIWVDLASTPDAQIAADSLFHLLTPGVVLNAKSK
jgi:LmbE family N-acetylglucosaminyl deacetylase